MPNPGRVLLIGVCLLIGSVRARGQERGAAPPGEAGWRRRWCGFTPASAARQGTFAHFGDSITVSLAFWAPLRHDRKNATPEMERAFRLVEARLRPECWQDWKGPAFGNEGGQTIRWADQHVDDWLEKLNPEVALVMFGTNDLTSLGARRVPGQAAGGRPELPGPRDGRDPEHDPAPARPTRRRPPRSPRPHGRSPASWPSRSSTTTPRS